MPAVEKPRIYQDIYSIPMIEALRELREKPIWVLWNYEERVNATTGEVKWTKPPYQVADPKRHAKSEDPATWGGFNSAVEAVKQRRADGLGMSLKVPNLTPAPDKWLAGIDLDACIDKSGRISDWAQDILNRAHNTYREKTVSGSGARVLGWVNKAVVTHRKFAAEDGGSLELYGYNCHRYVTVSGVPIGSCFELADITELMRELEQEFAAKAPPASPTKHTKPKTNGAEPNGSAATNSASNLFDFNVETEAVDYDALIRNGAPVGQRSDKFHSTVGHLARKGLSKEEIAEELAKHPGGIADKYESGGRLDREVERSHDEWNETWRKEAEEVAKERASAGTKEAPGVKPSGPEVRADDASTGTADVGARADKPSVRIIPGFIHRTATEAEAALISAGTQFYSRGGQIVRPIVEEVQATRGFKTLVTRARPVTPDSMVDHMARAAQFSQYDGRAKKFVIVDPPKKVASIILSRDGEWKFSPLAGLTTTQTLRPDGTIFGAPGYDPVTRMLLLAPPGLPPIPDEPSPGDAEAALALLKELLKEFPFADRESRAVGLSGLITPVVRGAMNVAPLHGIGAPTAGSGKSYWTDLCCAIATGQRCAGIAAGGDDTETEKRLVGVALTADQVISIDNCNGEIGGDFLCQLVERPICTARIMGGNDADHMRRIENRATVFANGNGLTPRADIVRRTLLATLDADSEKPYEREFRDDPLRRILANRGKYVAAILTIARAYLVSGERVKLTPLGSYEEWCRVVREPLVWLGEADPVKTIDSAREEDPELLMLTAVLVGLRKALGNEKMTAGGIKDVAEEREEASSGIDLGRRPYLHPELHQALVDAAGIRGTIDTRRLGCYLKRHKGRIVKGLKLVANQNTHLKQQVWGAEPR